MEREININGLVFRLVFPDGTENLELSRVRQEIINKLCGIDALGKLEDFHSNNDESKPYTHKSSGITVTVTGGIFDEI